MTFSKKIKFKRNKIVVVVVVVVVVFAIVEKRQKTFDQIDDERVVNEMTQQIEKKKKY